MGLGIWFAEDIARILRGLGEGVEHLVAQRGLHDAADLAYVAGYQAALRTVATSFGLALPAANTTPPPAALAEWIWETEAADES